MKRKILYITLSLFLIFSVLGVNSFASQTFSPEVETDFDYGFTPTVMKNGEETYVFDMENVRMVDNKWQNSYLTQTTIKGDLFRTKLSHKSENSLRYLENMPPIENVKSWESYLWSTAPEFVYGSIGENTEIYFPENASFDEDQFSFQTRENYWVRGRMKSIHQIDPDFSELTVNVQDWNDGVSCENFENFVRYPDAMTSTDTAFDAEYHVQEDGMEKRFILKDFIQGTQDLTWAGGTPTKNYWMAMKYNMDFEENQNTYFKYVDENGDVRDWDAQSRITAKQLRYYSGNGELQYYLPEPVAVDNEGNEFSGVYHITSRDQAGDWVIHGYHNLDIFVSYKYGDFGDLYGVYNDRLENVNYPIEFDPTVSRLDVSQFDNYSFSEDLDTDLVQNMVGDLGNIPTRTEHGEVSYDISGNLKDSDSVSVSMDVNLKKDGGYSVAGGSLGSHSLAWTVSSQTDWEGWEDNSYNSQIDSGKLEIFPELDGVWTFSGHSDDVFAVAVDSDGYVYSGAYNETVKKISPDGNGVWTFSGHSSRVMSVAVDSDGYVYSGAFDDTVKKISPDGNTVWTFSGHSDYVYAVAVDSDGYVYSGSGDDTVKKISPDGNGVWTFSGHSRRVMSVAVDSDGYVYSGSYDDTVKKIVQRVDNYGVWTSVLENFSSPQQVDGFSSFANVSENENVQVRLRVDTGGDGQIDENGDWVQLSDNSNSLTGSELNVSDFYGVRTEYFLSVSDTTTSPSVENFALTLENAKVFNVITDNVIETYRTEAQLQGEVSLDNGTADAYFYYRKNGKTTWQEHFVKTMDNSDKYSDNITGLSHSTEYEWKAVAKGSEENVTGDVKTFETKVDNYPIADFSFTENARAYENVFFNSENSWDDHEIVSYEWDWDNDGTYENTGENFTKMFESSDNYLVSLRVEDDSGQTDIKNKNVEILNASPTAKFGYSVDNDTVEVFADNSYDVDGEVVLYEWKWKKDESFVEGENVETYSYENENVYEITLRVKDGKGATDNVSKLVSIGRPTFVGSPDPMHNTEVGSLKSTLSVQVKHGFGSDMTVDFYWYDGTHIETVSDIGSGNRAETSGISLSASTEYKWYAVVRDAENDNIVSQNWRFETYESVSGTPTVKYDLSLLVKDEDRNPVSDATVEISSITKTTSDDGYVEFTNLVDDEYTITVDGYSISEETVIVNPADNSAIEITTKREKTAKGVLSENFGWILMGTSVIIFLAVVLSGVKY